MQTFKQNYRKKDAHLKTTLILTLLFWDLAFAAKDKNKVKKNSSNQINNEVISIDGEYSRRTMTQSERMKSLRSRLEKKTEQNLKKQIEIMRVKQEMELTRKIQATFKRQMNAMDNEFQSDSGLENL